MCKQRTTNSCGIFAQCHMDADWVKARLKAIDRTQDDLAAAIGRDRTVINKMLNEGRPKFLLEYVEPFAQVLDVSPLEILFRAGLWKSGMPNLVLAPVVNSVDAGRFADTTDDLPPSKQESIIVEYSKPTIFALRVHGDSMNRLAPAGSFIIVDYNAKDPIDRQLYVFRRHGEATFKRFRKDANQVWLEPDSYNPRHVAIFPDEGERLEVIGKVIDIRPEYPDEE